jgi:hypothetical protein
MDTLPSRRPNSSDLSCLLIYRVVNNEGTKPVASETKVLFQSSSQSLLHLNKARQVGHSSK